MIQAYYNLSFFRGVYFGDINYIHIEYEHN